MLRNLATKIKEIAKTKGRFGKFRNIIGNRILQIRTAVTKAVQYRIQENTPMHEKIIRLKKDLDNVTSHKYLVNIKIVQQLDTFVIDRKKKGKKISYLNLKNVDFMKN